MFFEEEKNIDVDVFAVQVHKKAQAKFLHR